MGSWDHDRLTEIFQAAAEMEPNEREAFLREACRGDVDLRAEVESLLQHDDDIPAILEDGALARRAAGELEWHPERIGSYRILEELGEGGMGVVYRAEQERPIRRPVAIKLIKSGIETRQVITRFETERQALALMNHPNIARVLDAGATDEGRPYFAMEYVDGEPITTYCDGHELGIRDRLELFIQVCEGVQHAHLKAIVHRDLKASNILVTRQDGRHVPKIIDFGVAKALDHGSTRTTAFTELGQVLGTPEYMSPEQAGTTPSRVDARTDVYSLGVLLYELIAGKRPFEIREMGEGGLDELRRRIRGEDPPKPSTRLSGQRAALTTTARSRATDPFSLVRQLRGDLDWITMKALEKEPARRYASPTELAADIRRHLDHEPVLAGPPSPVYRIAKLIARHRWGVAFAAVVLVLVSGSTLSWAIQTNRIAHETATAELFSGFLVDLFREPTGIGPRFPGQAPEETLAAGTRRIETRLDAAPVIQARLIQTMGELHRRMGLEQRARPLLEDAHATLLRLLGADHEMTLNSAGTLARLYLDQRQYDDAERLYVDVLRRRRRSAGRDQVDTLRAAHDLAYLYKVLGRNAEAVELFREAAEGLRRVLPDEQLGEALISEGLLAGVYLEQGRYADAEALLHELVEEMPRVLGEEHLETCAALYNLGCVHANRGRPQLALELLERVLRRGFWVGLSLLQEPHLQPLHGEPRFETLVQLHRMNGGIFREKDLRRADLAASRGRHDHAAALYVQVLQAMRRTGRGETTEAIQITYRLIHVYLSQGRYDEAEVLVREQLAGRDWARSAYPAEQGDVFWLLAQCHLGRDDVAAAIPLIRQTVALYEALAPRDHMHLYYRATFSALTGDREAAVRQLRAAVDRGYEWVAWMAIDLALAPLRGDAEFETIVAELELRDGDP